MKRMLCAVVMLLLPLAAGAQQKGNIELKSLAEFEIITKDAKGKKEVKRIDAAKAKIVPGDVVIFTTTYRNIGDQPAENVMITNPIPDHLIYMDKTAKGRRSRIEFSVDGGKSYGPAGKLTVVDASGKRRKAAASDYTHIRWTLLKSLAPGGKGTISFRARVK